MTIVKSIKDTNVGIYRDIEPIVYEESKRIIEKDARVSKILQKENFFK